MAAQHCRASARGDALAERALPVTHAHTTGIRRVCAAARAAHLCLGRRGAAVLAALDGVHDLTGRLGLLCLHHRCWLLSGVREAALL
jgi:hypothetical protein